MLDTAAFANQIRDLRRKTLAVVDDLVKKGQSYKLPPPPQALEDSRLKLLNNTYNVLVLGEMKRGKSSFVNALIGRDLLPTDVDVSTCEVFRVRRVQKEGYRLLFEDGTTQAIAVEQLKQYGSQGTKDLQGAPQLHQIIRWIEVDLPEAKFLPPGVNLLDTPGVGSLYTAHAQITQRFVPQADAVIFVLDSEKPIIEAELEFVGKVLDVTRNIFFVLTKVDMYDEEHWQDIQRQDIAHLQKRFKDRLGQVSIWPFSSSNLKLAAETGDAVYREVSYYDQLAAALQTFLFQAAGWERCKRVLELAAYYHSMTAKILQDRLAILQIASKQHLNARQQTAARRTQDFQTSWGAAGQKYQELLTSIRKTATTYKHDFVATLEAYGKLEATYRQKIVALKSSEEIQKLSETLDEMVVIDALTSWRTTCEETRKACLTLMTPFIAATDTFLPSSAAEEPDLAIHLKALEAANNDPLDPIKEANERFRTGIQVSAGVVLTVGGVVGVLFPPAALPIYLAGLPAVLIVGGWSALHGWKGMQKKQLQAVQEELRGRLTDLVREIRLRFFQSNIVGEANVVDRYFDTLVESMAQQIQQVVAASTEQMETEKTALDDREHMDEQKRSAKVEQAQLQLREWKTLDSSIATIIHNLEMPGQL